MAKKCWLRVKKTKQHLFPYVETEKGFPELTNRPRSSTPAQEVLYVSNCDSPETKQILQVQGEASSSIQLSSQERFIMVSTS